jgi:hypothetical protein
MPSELKNKKLIELASKAVSVNKALLEEEKEFIDAVERDQEMSLLEKKSDQINLLLRKENLFVGAIQMFLKSKRRNTDD